MQELTEYHTLVHEKNFEVIKRKTTANEKINYHRIRSLRYIIASDISNICLWSCTELLQ